MRASRRKRESGPENDLQLGKKGTPGEGASGKNQTGPGKDWWGWSWMREKEGSRGHNLFSCAQEPSLKHEACSVVVASKKEAEGCLSCRAVNSGR